MSVAFFFIYSSSFIPKLHFLFFIKPYRFSHLRPVLSNCSVPSHYSTKDGYLCHPYQACCMLRQSHHLEKCKRIKFCNKTSRQPILGQCAYFTFPLQTAILRQKAVLFAHFRLHFASCAGDGMTDFGKSLKINSTEIRFCMEKSSYKVRRLLSRKLPLKF